MKLIKKSEKNLNLWQNGPIWGENKWKCKTGTHVWFTGSKDQPGSKILIPALTHHPQCTFNYQNMLLHYCSEEREIKMFKKSITILKNHYPNQAWIQIRGNWCTTPYWRHIHAKSALLSCLDIQPSIFQNSNTKYTKHKYYLYFSIHTSSHCTYAHRVVGYTI